MQKFLILFLLSICSLYGQQENKDIKVKVLAVICDSIMKPDLDSYLVEALASDNDSITYYIPDDDGIIKLPSAGKYNLYHWGSELQYQIDIKNEELYEYKRHIPKIYMQWYVLGGGPYHYLCCDKLCDGYQEDFYDNGNLRIKGTFKDGYPKDSLVEFYPNGKTQRKTVIKNSGSTTQRYDSLGNLESKFWSSNSYYRNHNYKHTTYYSNGKIKNNISEINRIVKIDSYYTNGTRKIKQRKKYKIEYYENGNIKSLIKWKKSKDFEGYNFTIISKFFNETGELEKTEEDADYGHHRQPPFAYKFLED